MNLSSSAGSRQRGCEGNAHNVLNVDIDIKSNKNLQALLMP
jgi:hypothetical protein